MSEKESNLPKKEHTRRTRSIVNKEFFENIGEKNNDWQKNANCAGADTDMFFEPTRYHDAQAICRKCTVREECLEDGLRAYQQFGIWGGTIAAQREAIKRDRKKIKRSNNNS